MKRYSASGGQLGRPRIEKITGENLVMDILGIAYMDFLQGRMTDISKIFRLMEIGYPQYPPQFLRKLINNAVRSQWFNNPSPTKIHIVERGVELYLQMRQDYWAEKWARDNNIKAKWNIFLVIVGIVLTGLVIYLDLTKSGQ